MHESKQTHFLSNKIVLENQKSETNCHKTEDLPATKPNFQFDYAI